MKRLIMGVSLLLIGFWGAGCGTQPVQSLGPSQSPQVQTQLVTVVVVVTATPEVFTAEESTSTEKAETSVESWVLPALAKEYLGTNIRVRVETAYCSFQADINGTPTFCNDQLYPNHNFTFLIWGEDLSSFDRKCVIVEGKVELFQGKPQIEISSEEEIYFCGEEND